MTRLEISTTAANDISELALRETVFKLINLFLITVDEQSPQQLIDRNNIYELTFSLENDKYYLSYNDIYDVYKRYDDYITSITINIDNIYKANNPIEIKFDIKKDGNAKLIMNEYKITKATRLFLNDFDNYNIDMDDMKLAGKLFCNSIGDTESSIYTEVDENMKNQLIFSGIPQVQFDVLKSIINEVDSLSDIIIRTDEKYDDCCSSVHFIFSKNVKRIKRK